MSDDEDSRFENEQSLLNGDFQSLPRSVSAWEEDICDVDEDSNPHGKNINRYISFLRYSSYDLINSKHCPC